jgi:hypothetical protein
MFMYSTTSQRTTDFKENALHCSRIYVVFGSRMLLSVMDSGGGGHDGVYSVDQTASLQML